MHISYFNCEGHYFDLRDSLDNLFCFFRVVPNHMMPLISSSSPPIPTFHSNCWKRSSSSNPNFSSAHRRTLQGLPAFCKSAHTVFRIKESKSFVARKCTNFNDNNSSTTYDFLEQSEGEDEDTGSPWEGAVVYQRNASISHVEYCTTLERLGLGNISTDVSRSRASVMGLRVTKAVNDFPFGTPVLISVDVSKKKQKLRLDGIVRTVITLLCQRCAEPFSQSLFCNFSLLLTEKPVEEPKTTHVVVMFEEDMMRGAEEDDDEASIDWDDRIYFPPGEKTCDISKHIRDIVHLEIVIDEMCNPNCKGLCTKCGCNLNISGCNCSQREMEEKSYGPFRGLRERMQKP